MCITPQRCLFYIVLFIAITLCNHTFIFSRKYLTITDHSSSLRPFTGYSEL